MTKEPREQVIDLGFKPRPWQRHCMENWRRFNVVVLHRQGGKSHLAAMQLIQCAVTCQLPLGKYYYIAPELGQAKRDMWDRLKHILRPLDEAGGLDWSDSELWVRFKSNGALIRLLGASNPDTLRGGTLDGVVFDETAQIDPMVWDEIIEPMLMARKGWAIFIGTPKGINLLSMLYEKSQKDPTWFGRKWTVYETNAFTEDEIERKRAGTSPRVFQREFLCDFYASGDDQLISLELAMEASKRRYGPNDQVVARAPTVLGVDPARFGDDKSVIVRRQGLVCFPPMVYSGIDNMMLADLVAAQIIECEPAGVFIDHGAGAGVIDRLKQLGHTVTEVPFGGKALTPGFFNRRMEMWWKMKLWLESGGSIPEHPDLIRELATPTYWYNDNKDQKVLEPKDSIRERLPAHGSPDCFVAGTLVRTPQGQVPIERLREGDEVATPMGTRRIIKHWVTEASSLSTVEFSNGQVLTGKDKHEVFTWDAGFVRLDALALTNAVETDCWQRRLAWRVSSWCMRARSSGFKAQVATSSPGAKKRRSDFFIAESGPRLMERFRKAWRSIIAMATGATMPSEIWNACRSASTPLIIFESVGSVIAPSASRAWTQCDEPQPSGMDLQMGERGTESMPRKSGKVRHASGGDASNAASRSGRGIVIRSSARRLARCIAHGILVATTRIVGSARTAVARSWRTVTGSKPVVPVSVRTEGVVPTLVYNLTLDEDNVYYANGILVANCADSLALTFAADLPTYLDLREQRLTPEQRQARRYHPFDRDHDRRRGA